MNKSYIATAAFLVLLGVAGCAGGKLSPTTMTTITQAEQDATIAVSAYEAALRSGPGRGHQQSGT